jgi:hypothetical protein
MVRKLLAGLVIAGLVAGCGPTLIDGVPVGTTVHCLDEPNDERDGPPEYCAPLEAAARAVLEARYPDHAAVDAVEIRNPDYRTKDGLGVMPINSLGAQYLVALVRLADDTAHAFFMSCGVPHGFVLEGVDPPEFDWSTACHETSPNGLLGGPGTRIVDGVVLWRTPAP